MWIPWVVVACRGTEVPVVGPEPLSVSAVPVALRLTRGSDEVVLEVGVDTYRGSDRPTVVVQGAVHLADPAFFDSAVAALSARDLVLYEGLTDPDAAATPVAPGASLASLGDVLGLVVQGDAIDPDALGWRHADLTEAELRRLLLADGADPTWVEELLGDASPDLAATIERLRSAAETERALVRLALARGLVEEDHGEGSEAVLFERHVLGSRNAVVLERLAAVGDSVDEVGVWYGAAHLPDLGGRLQRAGWSAPEREWVPAIAVPHATLGLGAAQVNLLLR